MALVPQFDEHGFLRNQEAWNDALATALSEQNNLVLAEDHWHVIHAARAFHERTGKSPTMRLLVKIVAKEVSAELGSSIALLRLFGPTSNKLVALIAGLPKPSDCI